MFGFQRTPDYLSQLASANIILSNGAYFFGNLKTNKAYAVLKFSVNREGGKGT